MFVVSVDAVRICADITEHKAGLPGRRRCALDVRPSYAGNAIKPIRNMHGRAVNNAAYSFDSVADPIPGYCRNLHSNKSLSRRTIAVFPGHMVC